VLAVAVVSMSMQLNRATQLQRLTRMMDMTTIKLTDF
jgi:hypothetical protein